MTYIKRTMAVCTVIGIVWYGSYFGAGGKIGGDPLVYGGKGSHRNDVKTNEVISEYISHLNYHFIYREWPTSVKLCHHR